MKFLFIFPLSGFYQIAPKKTLRSGAYVPPLGILYLARMLEKEGHKVEVIDCNAEGINEENILSKVDSSDAVGMTVYSDPIEIKNSIRISKLIKEKDKNLPLVIGGPHCTLLPTHSMRHHPADILVKGEGELVMPLIAKALEGKKSLSSIPGICYRKSNRIVESTSNNIVEKLDNLPFPSRHLVEKYDYGYMQGSKIATGKATSILTSRGCPSTCRYCQISAFSPRYRIRSHENIAKEIKEIADAGYKTLIFIDDSFLASKKWAGKIMDQIIENNINLKLWIQGARVDSADLELYKKMKKAGVELISFGVESGNQDILDYYTKKITLEQVRESVKLSKKMGFFVHSSFILGAPIETKQHILDTIKFAKSIPLDAASFYTFGYLYGSDIWKEAVRKGQITKKDFWITADSNKGLGNLTEDELDKYCMKAFREFWFNPKQWIRQFYHAISYGDFRFLKMGFDVVK